MKRAGIRAGAAAFLAGIAFAAPALASDDSQVWAGGVVTARLFDHWRLSEEIIARFSDHRNGLYEIESNTLAGYRLNKVVTLWAGYTHDPQYAGGDSTIWSSAELRHVPQPSDEGGP